MNHPPKQTGFDAYEIDKIMHMRTTLNLDEELIETARELTGIQEKTELIHRGLRELIQREAARALARMGGTAPNMKDIPRRRSRKVA